MSWRCQVSIIAAKLGHEIDAAPCQPAGQDTVQIEVLEGQMTWLVHIIAAVVKCRLSSSTAESQETIDGDLAARAFGLLQIVDSGYDACYGYTPLHISCSCMSTRKCLCSWHCDLL